MDKRCPRYGQDDPEKVRTWIQDRITCHIPDNNSSPELYHLVSVVPIAKGGEGVARTLSLPGAALGFLAQFVTVQN